MSEYKHQQVHTYCKRGIIFPKESKARWLKCTTRMHTTEVKGKPNNTAENKCSFCKGNHRFYKCHSYLTMAPLKKKLTLWNGINFATIVSEIFTLCQSASQKIPVSKKDVLPNIIQHWINTCVSSKRLETKTVINRSKMEVNPQRKKERVSRLIPIKQAK